MPQLNLLAVRNRKPVVTARDTPAAELTPNKSHTRVPMPPSTLSDSKDERNPRCGPPAARAQGCNNFDKDFEPWALDPLMYGQLHEHFGPKCNSLCASVSSQLIMNNSYTSNCNIVKNEITVLMIILSSTD
ncbi:hypothetical protein TorRG33x02_226660 [Trema orientale]|uniref:Uncharacterized protein n=1 Tax=Trema orientale TaxID=63057 RepID=A0A2P5E7L7_TREOI|nr:hypothetical protein TorRG33x02_226660 [Trema orientale]